MIPDRFTPVLDELAPLAARFESAGHRLYLVGGTVRDLLVDAQRDDYDLDLTTDARPDEIKACLAGWATALWTQARERLKVVTVVCANRAYQILKIEMAMQRIGPPGFASKRLTDISQPAIDWVGIATGFGVPASTVTTVNELRAALEEAFTRSGPTLIE